jgi:phage terminase small subunit
MAKLSPKQARFVQEYLLDLNATQAAIRAGYSAKAAKEIGYRQLTKAHIAAEIEKAQSKRAERCEVTADWVIDELRKLACANMADYMKSTPEGGVVLDFAGLTRDQTAALSQVKVNGASVTFKLHDKRAALVDLGRYLGLFEKRKQQDVITVEADFTDVRDTIFRTLARLSAARISKGSGQIPDPGTTTEVAE